MNTKIKHRTKVLNKLKNEKQKQEDSLRYLESILNLKNCEEDKEPDWEGFDWQ